MKSDSGLLLLTLQNSNQSSTFGSGTFDFISKQSTTGDKATHPFQTTALASFKTVAEVAGVSRAWLYQQADIRARIEHLRKLQSKQKSVPVEQRASRSSNVAVVRTLKERVKKIQAENQDLRQQLEVAYGRLIHAEDEMERYKWQVEMLQRKQNKQQSDLPTQDVVPASIEIGTIKMVQDAGIPINATLRRVIAGASVETVSNAVEAFRQAAEESSIRHPGRWLKRAIEEKWQPNEGSEDEVTTELDRFNEWFPKAKAEGVALASRLEIRFLY